MAKKDETTDDETPTPPKPTPPAGRPPAKPKAKAGPVLLDLHRIGAYTCTQLEKMEKLAATNQERFKTHQIVLLPGLNLVDPELLDRFTDPDHGNPAFCERIDTMEIEPLGLARWHKIRDLKALELVKRTASIPTLEKLLEQEKREAVIEGLRDHIAECKDTQGKAGAARRAQRAHNRSRN